jgi:hypothetical protein
MPELTPEFWKHVAAVAFLILVFIATLLPKKKDHNKACKNDFEAVKQRINDCNTMSMCNKTEQEIDVFFDTYYKHAEAVLLNDCYSELRVLLTRAKNKINSINHGV